MKLGDIKGEVFVTWREDGAGRSTFGGGGDRQIGITTGLGEDKLTAINTGSNNDRFVNHLDTGSGSDRLLGITTGLGENKLTGIDNNAKRSNWDVICDVGTTIKQDGIDLQSDALAQQVNGTIGYEMLPVDFANNQVSFETGLPVEGIGSSNPMGIEPDQMVGVISRGDMFAAANELRSDNRF